LPGNKELQRHEYHKEWHSQCKQIQFHNL
jgi:hypothetical protein